MNRQRVTRAAAYIGVGLAIPPAVFLVAAAVPRLWQTLGVEEPFVALPLLILVGMYAIGTPLLAIATLRFGTPGGWEKKLAVVQLAIWAVLAIGLLGLRLQ